MAFFLYHTLKDLYDVYHFLHIFFQYEKTLLPISYAYLKAQTLDTFLLRILMRIFQPTLLQQARHFQNMLTIQSNCQNGNDS